MVARLSRLQSACIRNKNLERSGSACYSSFYSKKDFPMNAASENPVTPVALLRFELTAAEGTHLIDVLVNTDVLAPALENAKAFDALTAQLCTRLNIEFRNEMDQRNLIGLPLYNGHPLRGRWIGGSPVGLEHTQPAPNWSFEDRVKQALSDPTRFPILQGDISKLEAAAPGAEDYRRERKSLAFHEDLVSHAMEAQFGVSSISAITVLQIKTGLDLALDGMSC
jgi:hypothetical protein